MSLEFFSPAKQLSDNRKLEVFVDGIGLAHLVRGELFQLRMGHFALVDVLLEHIVEGGKLLERRLQHQLFNFLIGVW